MNPVIVNIMRNLYVHHMNYMPKKIQKFLLKNGLNKKRKIIYLISDKELNISMISKS